MLIINGVALLILETIIFAVIFEKLYVGAKIRFKYFEVLAILCLSAFILPLFSSFEDNPYITQIFVIGAMTLIGIFGSLFTGASITLGKFPLKTLYGVYPNQSYFTEKDTLFYRIINIVSFASGFWAFLAVGNMMILPLINLMMSPLRDMRQQMEDTSFRGAAIEAAPVINWWLYFAVMVTVLVICGGIWYFSNKLLTKLKPTYSRLQIRLFFNLEKAQKNAKKITEIDLDTMKKILKYNKSILLRQTTDNLTQEDALINQINLIEVLHIKSIMIDKVYLHATYIGVVESEVGLKFYMVDFYDKDFNPPPNANKLEEKSENVVLPEVVNHA